MAPSRRASAPTSVGSDLRAQLFGYRVPTLLRVLQLETPLLLRTMYARRHTRGQLWKKTPDARIARRRLQRAISNTFDTKDSIAFCKSRFRVETSVSSLNE